MSTNINQYNNILSVKQSTFNKFQTSSAQHNIENKSDSFDKEQKATNSDDNARKIIYAILGLAVIAGGIYAINKFINRAKIKNKNSISSGNNTNIPDTPKEIPQRNIHLQRCPDIIQPDDFEKILKSSEINCTELSRLENMQIPQLPATVADDGTKICIDGKPLNGIYSFDTGENRYFELFKEGQRTGRIYFSKYNDYWNFLHDKHFSQEYSQIIFDSQNKSVRYITSLDCAKRHQEENLVQEAFDYLKQAQSNSLNKNPQTGNYFVYEEGISHSCNPRITEYRNGKKFRSFYFERSYIELGSNRTPTPDTLIVTYPSENQNGFMVENIKYFHHIAN